MTKRNDEHAINEILEEAVRMLRNASVIHGPTAKLESATIAAIEERINDQKVASPVVAPSRRRVLRWAGLAALGSAAATVAAASFFPIGASSSAAFGQAIEKLKSTEAVKFKIEVVIQGGAKLTHTVVVRGSQLRVEGSPVSTSNWIIDGDKKAALIIDATKKLYQTIDMSSGGITPMNVYNLRIREELLALKDQDAKHEGAETIQDEMAEKYFVANGKAFYTEGDWRIWIGQRSKLPVKVEVTSTLRGITTHCVYEAFDWEPQVEASTFDIEPPADFEEKSLFNVFPPLPKRERK